MFIKQGILIVLASFLVAGAYANLNGSDDFDDNEQNINIWAVGGAYLHEQNQRLEFVHSETEGAYSQWSYHSQAGSRTESWYVQLDISSGLNPSGWVDEQSVELGIKIENPNDPGNNRFSIWREIGAEQVQSELETYRDIFAQGLTAGVEGNEDSANQDAGDWMQLRISYNPGSESLIASYRYDAEDIFTQLQTYSVADWEMGEHGFSPHIFASSDNRTVDSGDLYGDNFLATTIPEPGSAILLLCGIAALRTLCRHRK